jgi:hypothetical protein
MSEPRVVITAPHLTRRKGPAKGLPERLAEAAGVAAGSEAGGEEAPAVVAPVAELAEPTMAELAVNFGGAVAHWLAAGLPVVSEAAYQARAAACGSCELWDGRARLGFGKCRAAGCGCTKLKWLLATERCKHPGGSRWPA